MSASYAGEWPRSAPAGPFVLTLEQAYDRALATDQAIRIAYWEVRKANLLPWSALARLGPRLTASAGYDRSGRSTKQVVSEFNNVTTTAPNGSPSSRVVLQTFSSYAGAGTESIAFNQPLIDLSVFPAYKVGKLSIASARLSHQYTIRGTLYGVASAYYEVLKQRRLVEVDSEAIRLFQEQYHYAQIRAQAGEVTRADVLGALVNVEKARQTLTIDEATLEIDLNNLRNILNYAPEAAFQVTDPPHYPPGISSFDALLGRAYEHREDLRVKMLAIEEDIQRKNEILAEYGPTVAAQGSADIANDTGSSRSRSTSWSAGLTVQIPIFTGGQREIDLLTALRQIEETRLQCEQARKTVESDVRTAYLTVHSTEETIKATRVRVSAAEQTYQDRENQYKAGTATSVDVLTALNDLNTARKDLAQQTYSYELALRDVEQTVGIFQEERVEKYKVR